MHGKTPVSQCDLTRRRWSENAAGYQLHALQKWRQAAPYCEAYLGFDLTAWPRYAAGWRFLARTSMPLGPERRVMLPAGDTHPGNGMDPVAAAAEAGYAGRDCSARNGRITRLRRYVSSRAKH